MAGELNNAATYFSSFANVSKQNINIINGKIGDDSSCTWKKWDYKTRIKDVELMKKFKEKTKFLRILKIIITEKSTWLP